jgi:hypothetical protein
LGSGFLPEMDEGGSVFYLCRSCDRGQCYCGEYCRHQARLGQRRKANSKYQAGRCKAPRRRRCGDIVEERQRRRCPSAAAPRRAAGATICLFPILIIPRNQGRGARQQNVKLFLREPLELTCALAKIIRNVEPPNAEMAKRNAQRCEVRSQPPFSKTSMAARGKGSFHDPAPGSGRQGYRYAGL